MKVSRKWVSALLMCIMLFSLFVCAYAAEPEKHTLSASNPNVVIKNTLTGVMPGDILMDETYDLVCESRAKPKLIFESTVKDDPQELLKNFSFEVSFKYKNDDGYTKTFSSDNLLEENSFSLMLDNPTRNEVSVRVVTKLATSAGNELMGRKFVSNIFIKLEDEAAGSSSGGSGSGGGSQGNGSGTQGGTTGGNSSQMTLRPPKALVDTSDNSTPLVLLSLALFLVSVLLIVVFGKKKEGDTHD